MTTIGNKFAQLGTSIINLVGTRASKNMDNLTSTGEANIVEIVENAGISGGSSRIIGEIVASTVPLTDAGLHLLDGALISGSGVYSAFVTYIAGLESTYPNLFVTESAWQSSVTTYGVCGKFVYDSTNNTVRLPKVTGILEGTTDVTALGDLVEAGLPNITGTWGGAPNAYVGQYGTGAIEHTDVGGWYGYNTGGGQGAGFNFDASDSNSIYGNSNTVQPQTIKILYYIVIATSAKTDIQVDIDEVTTDLNGKADVDLTNCTKPHIVEAYVNGKSWYNLYSNGWCEQGGVQYCTVATTTQVALLKSFTNTNYSVLLEPNKDATDIWGHGDTVPPSSITTSSFGIYIHSSGGSYNIFWQACGYIR